MFINDKLRNKKHKITSHGLFSVSGASATGSLTTLGVGFQVEGKDIPAISKTRYSLAWNAVRQRFFLELVDLATFYDAPWGPQQAQGSQQQQPAVDKGELIKVKFATVLDQGSDQEVIQHSPRELAALRSQYVKVFGDPPEEKRDVTDAQLSAFKHRVTHGATIFADFGVFRKDGAQMERMFRFTNQIMDHNGMWHNTEVPGPRDLATWLECWDCFRTVAIMTNIATTSTLEKYKDEFCDRVQSYPECWHIHVKADMKARSQEWVVEKRRQEDLHQRNPGMSLYTPEMPWNSIIRANAADDQFWRKHVREPALKYSLLGGPRGQKRPWSEVEMLPGSAEDMGLAEPREKGKGKHKGQPKGRGKSGKEKKADWQQYNNTGEAKQRGDGRYTKTRKGLDLCYAWNRSQSGCKDKGVCPDKRAHACEWCLGQHRAVNCKHGGGKKRWD